MTDNVVILTTAASKREARKIARLLVRDKLAACVNITQPIESIYRWQGKVVTGREFQLIIKSIRKMFPEIRDAILKVHSYDTPEVIALPVIQGSREYLAWLRSCLKRKGGRVRVGN